MAAKILRSLAVSAFCEDMAMMLAAGIQVDDALSLMRGDSGDGPLYDAASAVLERVQMGEPLAEAVEQCGYFPAYAAQLVAAGEAAGRTESVLKSLAVYYETQDKLEKRLKSAVIYPAVLLFLMAGVLAVLVARVLPVFTGVYTGLAGSVAASSYAYITAANIIGWASLCLVIVLTALLLTGAAAARTQRGNGLFRTLFEKLPFTSAAARRLAEAQFTTALATFTASGMDTDTAMERASDMVRHRALRAQLESCRRQMLEGRSLAQAGDTAELDALLPHGTAREGPGVSAVLEGADGRSLSVFAELTADGGYRVIQWQQSAEWAGEAEAPALFGTLREG